MKKLALVAAGFIWATAAMPVLAETVGSIVVQNPWVRSAPPNAKVLAAFMTLENKAEKEIKLVDARVPKAYGQVELHRTLQDDGMMRMIQQPFIPVPARGKVVLKPGSWHIMLFGPNTIPVEGEQVPVTLVFDDGSSQQVQAVVKQGPMMHHKH